MVSVYFRRSVSTSRRTNAGSSLRYTWRRGCAIRSPQTPPEARSVAITRPERRPRRVPPCGYGPKPQEAGEVDPGASADRSDLRRRGAHRHGRDRQSMPPRLLQIRLLQRYIAPERTIEPNQRDGRVRGEADIRAFCTQGAHRMRDCAIIRGRRFSARSTDPLGIINRGRDCEFGERPIPGIVMSWRQASML